MHDVLILSLCTYASANQDFSANKCRWTVLDAVFPETLIVPSSLPELLPDAQHTAEGVQKTLFLQ